MIGVMEAGGDTTIKNLLETEDFIDLTKHTHSWYTNGYMMPDCLSNTETGDSMILNKKAVTCFNNGAYFDETDYIKEDLVRVPLTPAKADTTTISGMCWGISANSKNKDASWKMLEVLYSDADVVTLLTDGIKDRNYVVDADAMPYIRMEKIIRTMAMVQCSSGGCIQTLLLLRNSRQTD